MLVVVLDVVEVEDEDELVLDVDDVLEVVEVVLVVLLLVVVVQFDSRSAPLYAHSALTTCGFVEGIVRMTLVPDAVSTAFPK